MRNCPVQVKILGVEDQRFTLPFWLNEVKIYVDI